MSSVHFSSFSSASIRFFSALGLSSGLPSKIAFGTRVRGCGRSPAIIPDSAIWLSCHTRSGFTPSASATFSFGRFPSQYSRISMHVACAS